MHWIATDCICFSVALEVSVKDTNDHAPEFDQPWYTVEVDEGKPLIFCFAYLIDDALICSWVDM